MTVIAEPPTFPRVGMEWGIKRSFIRYVAYLPDGNHVTEDGAYLNDASIFTFPNFVVAEPDIGVIRFQGTVKVGGHGGLLGVLLSDPWVHLSGDEGVLSVIDPGEWPSRSHRLVLADLEVALHCDFGRVGSCTFWRSLSARDCSRSCRHSLAVSGVSAG